MLESSSAYTSEVIPAGTYTGQTTDISTIGVKSVLITKSDVSDDTIEQLTSLLFEKENELSYSNSLKLELTYDLQQTVYLFHSTMERKGIMKPADIAQINSRINFRPIT